MAQALTDKNLADRLLIRLRTELVIRYQALLDGDSSLPYGQSVRICCANGTELCVAEIELFPHSPQLHDTIKIISPLPQWSHNQWLETYCGLWRDTESEAWCQDAAFVGVINDRATTNRTHGNMLLWHQRVKNVLVDYESTVDKLLRFQPRNSELAKDVQRAVTIHQHFTRFLKQLEADHFESAT